MKTPLVSVVIPFYRAEDLLGEAIDSVLSQTFQDLEIILVDNNANSKSKKIAEEWVLRYPETIRILQEKIQGVCSSRNTGIRESKGQYIALLDEDDIMFPQKLEKQFSFLQEHPEIALVTSYVDRVSHDGKEILSHRVKTLDYATIETEIKLIRNIFSVNNGHGSHSEGHHGHRRKIDSFRLTFPSTYFFSKDLAKKAGMFNPCFDPGFFEDIEFQTRMFSWGDFFQIPESLTYYRTTSMDYEQKRSSNRSEKIFLNHHLFMEILYRRYWKQGREAQTAIRRLRSHYLKNLGASLFSFPDGERLGRKFLSLAIEENPYSLDAWKFFVKSYLPRSMHPRLFWFSEFKPSGMGELGVALQKISHSWPPILTTEKEFTS